MPSMICRLLEPTNFPQRLLYGAAFFHAFAPVSCSIRFPISRCRVSYARASASALTSSFPIMWGTAGEKLFDGEAFRAAPLHNGGVPGSERGNKRFQAARLQRFHGAAVQDLGRRRAVSVFGCVIKSIMSRMGPFGQHGGLQGGGAGGKDFAF